MLRGSCTSHRAFCRGGPPHRPPRPRHTGLPVTPHVIQTPPAAAAPAHMHAAHPRATRRRRRDGRHSWGVPPWGATSPPTPPPPHWTSSHTPCDTDAAGRRSICAHVCWQFSRPVSSLVGFVGLAGRHAAAQCPGACYRPGDALLAFPACAASHPYFFRVTSQG